MIGQQPKGSNVEAMLLSMAEQVWWRLCFVSIASCQELRGAGQGFSDGGPSPSFPHSSPRPTTSCDVVDLGV